jgi:hypothetical protein
VIVSLTIQKFAIIPKYWINKAKSALARRAKRAKIKLNQSGKSVQLAAQYLLACKMAL